MPGPEADRDVILGLFLDLVQVPIEGDDRPAGRRRCLRSELEGDVPGTAPGARARLIADLVQARLLSLSAEGPEPGAVRYVEIIHESLIANWDHLKEAIAAQR